MTQCDVTRPPWVNTLRPKQNGRLFADDIFICISLNENVWISVKISLKFVLNGPINNIPALVQIMAWRRPGDKPLSEPMIVRLPTHICVTRPPWVKPGMSLLSSKLHLISSLSESLAFWLKYRDFPLKLVCPKHICRLPNRIYILHKTQH